MSMSLAQLARIGVIGAIGGAYLWMGFEASISSDPPLLALLVGLAPLSFSAIAAAWHSRSLALQIVCAGALVWMGMNIEFLRTNTPWVYFIQHFGMHVLLGIMFGRTLTRLPEQALCSQISALVCRDATDVAFFRYTWKVTLAWTIYFAMSALISGVLFFCGPLDVWSVFANLLTPVLIGLMFAVEFLIRLRVLPPEQHASISRTIAAYREYSQRKKSC
jgi:uncharacterized membrane protein